MLHEGSANRLEFLKRWGFRFTEWKRNTRRDWWNLSLALLEFEFDPPLFHRSRVNYTRQRGWNKGPKRYANKRFNYSTLAEAWSFIRFLEITPDYGQQCVPGPNLADFKRKRAVLRPNICIIAREFGRTQRHIGILVEFIGLIVTWRFFRVISVGMSDVLTEIFSSLGDN